MALTADTLNTNESIDSSKVSFKIGSGCNHLTFILHWNRAGLLTKIEWVDEPALEDTPGSPISPASFFSSEFFQNYPYGVAALMRDLKNYFFSGEPLMPAPWSLLDLAQLTDFQKNVFKVVSTIPHGETRTYSWVAYRVGKPLAGRAVGQALRRNPFPVLVPCHRVVSGKSLGGFMGVKNPDEIELQLKSWLIELETSYQSPLFSFVPRGAHIHPLLDALGTAASRAPAESSTPQLLPLFHGLS